MKLYGMAGLVANSNHFGAGGKMKGITPIIAILVLLLITVALTSMTYQYLMSYMESLIGQNIEVVNTYCYGGTDFVAMVRNIGTKDIPLSKVNVQVETLPAGASPGWLDMTGTDLDPATGTIPVGQIVQYKIKCPTGTCTPPSRYSVSFISPSGRVMDASLSC
jgi:flagellin-like protein